MAAVKELVSDFSGAPGATKVSLTVGGVTFTADLTPADIHHAQISLGQFMAVANRDEPARIKRDRNARIRLWGRANGYPHISEAGRLPAELVTAYYTQYPEEKP